MSKFSKVVLIIAGCALVLGGVICLGVGAFTGFNYHTFSREANANLKNYELEDLDLTFTNDITELNFDFGVADVTIKEGDSFTLTARNILKDSLKTDDSGQRLTIRQKDPNEMFGNWFNFGGLGWHDDDNGWGWGYGIEAPTIVVTIPAGVVFDDAVLSFGVGDSKVSGLSAKRANIDGGVGTIDFDDMKFDTADVNTGVGDLSFSSTDIGGLELDGGVGTVKYEGSIGGPLRINVGVGDIIIDGAIDGKTNVDGGVGSLKFRGTLTGNATLNAGVGDIEIDVTGSPDDYDFDVEDGLGDNSFNGRDNSFPSNRDAANKVNISGGVGSIEVTIE